MATPRERGYTWPAEWAPQAAVWLAWPHDASLWPIDLEPVLTVMARLAAELSAVQDVCILVPNRPARESATRRIRAAAVQVTNAEAFRFVEIATDDSWLRDNGPIFINRPAGQALVGWGFNGWGKFQPYENDAAVPSRLAEELGLPLFAPGVILEGGAIDGNGAGTALTTEQCLLHPNRNPGLCKTDYERLLRDYLGIEKVIWLGQGLCNDHTDGHVDVIARFVAPDTVVTLMASDPSDPCHAALTDNRLRLERATDAAGKPLRVVELPMPDPVIFEGKRLAAGYANFVIANRLVVVPTYGCRADDDALAILAALLPDRRVIGLPAQDLLCGGGAFHCLSQHQPAHRTGRDDRAGVL